MAGPPLTHAPHLFVDDLTAPVTCEGDRHHFAVLRIRAGAPVVLCDGSGAWRLGRYGDEIGLDGPIVGAPAPASVLHIAFALTKAGKPELVVQKLTELAVDRITIIHAERSIPQWDEARAAKHLTRLRRIARESAMQSRRVTLPAIDGLTPYTELAAREAVLVAERGGAHPAMEPIASTVAIGPEGGFTDAERALAAGALRLGANVLRAETAAIAAAAVLGLQRS